MSNDGHATGDTEQPAAGQAAQRLLAYYEALTERLSGNRRAQLTVALVVLVVIMVPSVLLLDPVNNHYAEASGDRVRRAADELRHCGWRVHRVANLLWAYPFVCDDCQSIVVIPVILARKRLRR